MIRAKPSTDQAHPNDIVNAAAATAAEFISYLSLHTEAIVDEHAERLVRRIPTAELDARDSSCADGDTLLIAAIRRLANLPRTVKALITSGADVNETNNLGYKALHFAFATKYPDMCVQWLLEAGARTSIVSNDGDTPLMDVPWVLVHCDSLASTTATIRAAGLMLQHIDVSHILAKTRTGKSVLTRAMYRMCDKTVDFLELLRPYVRRLAEGDANLLGRFGSIGHPLPHTSPAVVIPVARWMMDNGGVSATDLACTVMDTHYEGEECDEARYELLSECIRRGARVRTRPDALFSMFSSDAMVANADEASWKLRMLHKLLTEGGAADPHFLNAPVPQKDPQWTFLTVVCPSTGAAEHEVAFACAAIRELISSGADPNLPNQPRGHPPISCVRHMPVAIVFVEAGVNVNLASANGMTPLAWIIDSTPYNNNWETPKITQPLLDAGADGGHPSVVFQMARNVMNEAQLSATLLILATKPQSISDLSPFLLAHEAVVNVVLDQYPRFWQQHGKTLMQTRTDIAFRYVERMHERQEYLRQSVNVEQTAPVTSLILQYL